MRWVPLLLLVGCYVSKGKLDDAWDVDGDGWPAADDCAPDAAEVHPFAADPRGDGCDTDCGAQPDADGDDWPDVSDCGADDPAIFPCAPDAAGDGVDSDCDGEDTPRTDVCAVADPDFPEVAPFESCPG